MLDLSEVPVTIKPGSQLKASSTQPRGEGGKPTKITEVELYLVLEVSDHMGLVETLFPGADATAKLVAGDEGHQGCDLSSRTKMPEHNLEISYDGRIFLDQANCPIKKKAALKINHKGDVQMILRPMVKVSAKELGELGNMVNADCKITMCPTTQDMAVDAKPTTKLRQVAG